MTGILDRLRRRRVELASAWAARPQRRFAEPLSLSQAFARFPDRRELYEYMHHCFHRGCPPEVVAHREWFRLERRGFGEDAFHAMWTLLMQEFRPRRCLEIGVYRGQVVSLWALLARLQGFACEVHGISPFTAIGDEVSRYREDIDYLDDTLRNFAHFGLQDPTLTRALSTDPAGLAAIGACRWDLVYIDGSHDYEVVLSDFEHVVANLSDGGLVVLDDSSLYAGFDAPPFAFAGHPGPSRVVRDHAAVRLRWLGGVGHNNVFSK